MKLAVIALSEAGFKIARKITERLPANLYVHSRLEGEGSVKTFSSDLKTFVGTIFHRYDGLIFIMAAGIVTRVISPYVKSKKTDPAVIVADDTERFVISMLSGHLGGGNDLAEEIARCIGAIPVITTSTDLHGVTAFDMFAQRQGWTVERIGDLKKVSRAQIEGGKILMCTDENIHVEPPPSWGVITETPSADCSGAVVITNRLLLPEIPPGVPYIILRPRNITVGIGCRTGIPGYRIAEGIQKACEMCGKSPESLVSIATVSDKREEKGIIQAAEKFDIPLKIIDKRDILEVECLFETSGFVKNRIGVGTVAEACAYLGSERGRMILHKTKQEGMTLAFAESSYNFYM